MDTQVIDMAPILEECWSSEHINRIIKGGGELDGRLNGDIAEGMQAPNSCD